MGGTWVGTWTSRISERYVACLSSNVALQGPRAGDASLAWAGVPWRAALPEPNTACADKQTTGRAPHCASPVPTTYTSPCTTLTLQPDPLLLQITPPGPRESLCFIRTHMSLTLLRTIRHSPPTAQMVGWSLVGPGCLLPAARGFRPGTS